MESPEDEAFNEIERQAKQRKESVRSALQYPQKDIDLQREQQINAQASTPPQRTGVGLTDEEVELYWDWEDFQTGAGRSTIFEMVRDIEAKLKEKNDRTL